MMKHYYQAECLKIRHTSSEKLMIWLPVFAVILSAFLTNTYYAVDSYNWWYIALFPGLTALICSVIGHKDKKLKNQAIWTLPIDMGNVWNGKVLCGIRNIGISLVFFLLLVLAGGAVLKHILHVTFVVEPSLGAQVLAVIVLWICSLWQVPFCLLLSQITGFFPTLLIHMGLYTVMAVFFSLKPFFMAFPGALSPRIMCAVLGVLPNGLPAVEGSMTYSPELVSWSSLAAGIPAAIFWFVLLWFAGKTWYERQVDK